MQKQIHLISILAISLMLVACDSKKIKPNLLDAADIYNAHPEAFAEIVLSRPKPLLEFTRIPARDPMLETTQNTKLIARLRKNFPIEHIDFYPRSRSGRDEIDVVIKRYGQNTEWTVVSVIYLSKPLSPPSEGSNMELFDKCDHRSVDWLEKNKKKGPALVFCQINSEWYAYQKIG
ncbi:MAG: hypothetical protein HKP25_06755 [Marinicaulis sp.]|nr:hypothetical protein [Marinicaulis sp.]